MYAQPVAERKYYAVNVNVTANGVDQHPKVTAATAIAHQMLSVQHVTAPDQYNQGLKITKPLSFI